MNGYRPTAIIDQYTNSATLPAEQRTRAELFYLLIPPHHLPHQQLLLEVPSGRKIEREDGILSASLHLFLPSLEQTSPRNMETMPVPV